LLVCSIGNTGSVKVFEPLISVKMVLAAVLTGLLTSSLSGRTLTNAAPKPIFLLSIYPLSGLPHRPLFFRRRTGLWPLIVGGEWKLKKWGET
jgi:hypothetical protein